MFWSQSTTVKGLKSWRFEFETFAGEIRDGVRSDEGQTYTKSAFDVFTAMN